VIAKTARYIYMSLASLNFGVHSYREKIHPIADSDFAEVSEVEDRREYWHCQWPRRINSPALAVDWVQGYRR
jgi:hypothetical protein